MKVHDLLIRVVSLVILICPLGPSEAQFLPIFDWVRSFFGHYEQPGYISVRNVTSDVEERVYPPLKWACCEQFLTPDTRDTKISEMFMTLFRYMQGKNEAGQKLETTIPVATKVDHRNGKIRSYEMCFYLPSEVQNSPPRPTDSKVKIVRYPELRVYAKRYGGYSNKEMEAQQLQTLATVLKNASIPYFEDDMGDRATYFFCGYDSPTKFWNRRNEVWLLSNTTARSINHHFDPVQER